MRNKFLSVMQCRVARIAVGPSAVRGKGNAGVAKAAREYLSGIDLSRFGTDDEAAFRRALNDGTERLRKALPKGAQNWGLARKVLNIFLRDCAYTTFLSETYHLARAEESFEIPLDSITARALKQTRKRGELPRWPGVKHVNPELSHKFQSAALVEAQKFGVARMHLDAYWWAYSRAKS